MIKKKIYQITQIWNEFLFLVFLFPSHFKAHESWAPDISKIHVFSPVLCMLHPSTGVNKLWPLFLLSSSLLIQLSHHLPNDRGWPSYHTTLPLKTSYWKILYLAYMTRLNFHLDLMECLPPASLLPCLYRFSLPPYALCWSNSSEAWLCIRITLGAFNKDHAKTPCPDLRVWVKPKHWYFKKETIKRF